MENIENIEKPNDNADEQKEERSLEKNEENNQDVTDKQDCSGNVALRKRRFTNRGTIVFDNGEHIRTNWMGTAITSTLIAVMIAYGLRSYGLSKETLKTCYIMTGTYVLLSIVKLVQKIGDGKVDAKQIMKKVGFLLVVLIIPFIVFCFIEGHTFVVDVICKEFCPIERKQFGFCLSEAAFVFVYPKIIGKNFTCPSKKDINKILSEKIDNATESLRQHITETCGGSEISIDIEKIQVEMKKICKLEVEKNTAQDFVQIIKHFDAHESYARCDEERHSVIQQLNQVQSGMSLLNKSIEEQQKRTHETSKDMLLSSQALLFDGSTNDGYLQSLYIGASSKTLGSVKDCVHETWFHQYNNYLQQISDLSKDKSNRPLQIKNEFLVFAKKVLALDIEHESHEVFRHLKHRIISDVGLLNVCSIWDSSHFSIDLRDAANGFKDVICKI